MSEDIDLDLDDEAEAQDDQPDVRKDNAAFAQLRKEAKAAKILEKEVQELRAFKAEREQAERETAEVGFLEQMGADMRSINAYKELHAAEKADEDLVAALRAKHFGEEAGDEGAPAAPTTGFTPTVIEGAALGSKFYTFEQYEEIRREDPAKADQLRRAGRVQAIEKPWATLPQ